MSKDYGSIWILTAKSFILRVDDDDSITREVSLELDDPRIGISPTMVECEPLPDRELLAHELLARCRNRFLQIGSS